MMHESTPPENVSECPSLICGDPPEGQDEAEALLAFDAWDLADIEAMPDATGFPS